MPDLTLYVRRELAARTEVTSLVGSSATWPVWIWRWELREPVEGTGKRAVVISRPRGWTVPNRHNTAEFPMVQVDAFADCTRDAGGHPVTDDAEERALELAGVIRKGLHVPQGGEIEWGDAQGRVRVVSSVAAQDPEVVRLEGGVVRAIQRFEIIVG